MTFVTRRPAGHKRSAIGSAIPSQACTTIWRVIFPPLSSIIAEQNTLVPSGYAQLCVKARTLAYGDAVTVLILNIRPPGSEIVSGGFRPRL